MGRWLERVHDERGAVTYLVAGALVAVMGFGALALDAGRLYIERVHLQTVAEAAALAGAGSLPNDPDQARDQALAYVLAHLDPAAVVADIDVSADEETITVQLHSDVAMTLARVLGIERSGVAAAAAARVGKAGAAYGAVPLGVFDQDFALGQEYDLKVGSGSSNCGNYQALALGGQGANNYEENLREGYQGWLEVGDEVDTEPGNMSNPTRRGLEWRIDADPYATWDNHAVTSPRRLLVPIISGLDCGRDEVTIVGFAVFFLEDIRGNVSVVGRFIEAVISAEPVDWDDLGDFGTKVVRLIG
ncbi:MAG TPA: pilus assembly protein TadG-related protein [Bacillota bacterium]